jgi:hypothetical protein
MVRQAHHERPLILSLSKDGYSACAVMLLSAGVHAFEAAGREPREE